MKPFSDYGETITSGNMQTGAATIELTPEMFTLLSDGMYQDKVLAPIRESICNARDAHVEKGVAKPLEVHVPSRLEPFFHVRDFGTGLSEVQVLGYFDEELNEYVPGLYLRYGKSTKRDDNLQIGGFGIGCKSPLAYSDSFIVESFQGGVVKVYTIYKEDGIPNVAKLTEKATTEPDGLKVKIAVASHDTDRFVSRITSFLRHFNYDVVTTGQRISYKAEYVLQTATYDTVKVGYSEQGRIKASMGGVLYSVSDKYKDDLEQVTKTNMLIMKFEIGDLSVAGSRETLSENKDTVDKLDETVSKIKAEFYAVMQAEVENSKHSPYEALGVLRQYELIRNDWRSSKWVVTKAASDFTIGGEPVNDVMEQYALTRVRNIQVNGGYDNDSFINLTAMREVPIVLEVDKGTGYLKVAKKLSAVNNRCAVVLSQSDATMQELKDFFGEANLTIEKVSVKYAEFFPKGAVVVGKVKVAKSGLFNTKDMEITEVDEGQKGFYIPFERSFCIMTGRPAHKGLEDFSKINRFVKALIEAGQLKEDELFYSRKSGMRAIKKTKLVELTWDDLKLLARKAYTPSDYKAFIRESCLRRDNPATGKHKALEPFWETVKHNYPVWADTKDVTATKGGVFLSKCGVIGLLESGVEVDQIARNELYSAESLQFTVDYPMLDAFGGAWWRFTDEMVHDIVDFCEWKAIQQGLKNAA